MTVVARLKPAEPELQRGAPDGQLASIDLCRLFRAAGLSAARRRAYGQLASESPSVQDMPFPFPKPTTDEPLGAAFCRLRGAGGAGGPAAPPTRRRPSCAPWWGGRPGRAPRRGWSTRARARAGLWSRPGAGSRAHGIDRGRARPAGGRRLTRGHLAGGRARRRARVVRADDYRDTPARARRRRHPLPRQPALRVRHHGWRSVEGVADALRGGALPRLGQPAWRGCTVHFFLATAQQAAPGDAGASSRRRSGWTPTTGAWCGASCSAGWAARRCT